MERQSAQPSPQRSAHPSALRRRGVLAHATCSGVALGLAGVASHQTPLPALAATLAGGQEPSTVPVAGVYRLHSPEFERQVALDLRSNGVAVLTEVSDASSAVASGVASGVWGATSDRPDEVRVTLTTRRGQPLPSPEVFTVAFSAGFPARLQSASGTDWLAVEDLTFTLGSGDTHPLVRTLQAHLRALAVLGAVPFWASLPSSGPSGAARFDEATRRAVTAFQADQRLVPTGAVDLATWRALTSAALLRQTRDLPGPIAPLALPATTAQGENVVYLTFDDGPNPPFTQQVLEVLARYGARATFFAVGEQVKSFPAQVRAEASAGHYVANHTFDHHTLEGLSRQRFVEEAQQTRSLILDAAGDLFGLDKDVRYLRPPYGATDATTQQYAAELGYTLVLWDVDPQDWRRPGAGQIASHVLSHVHPGAVVLMHDGGGPRDQSVAALNTILPQLAARGYVFHSIFDKYSGTPASPAAPSGGTPSGAAPSGPAPAGSLRVAGTGTDGVNVRQAPSRSARVLVALAEGAVLTDLGGRQNADGQSWVQVRTTSGVAGWVAGQFVTR